MVKMCVPFVFALLVALHMSSNSVEGSPYRIDEEVEASPNNIDDEMVLFDSSNLPESTLPEACEGKTFCFEKGDNYPEEKIKELLVDMPELIVSTSEDRTSVGDRAGEDFDPDCPSTPNTEPIYYITDENDKVRVVVQSKEKFQQIYTVKTCTNEGPIERDTPHFLKSSHILKTFKMECVSTKMDLDFFVLSDEVDYKTNKPKMEIARAKGGIPVCCKCRYNVKS